MAPLQDPVERAGGGDQALTVTRRDDDYFDQAVDGRIADADQISAAGPCDG